MFFVIGKRRISGLLSLIILLFVLWLSVIMLNTAQQSKYALENTSEHIIMVYILLR